MSLNPTLKQQLHRDGFVVLKDFVSTESCEVLQQRADELVSEFDPVGLKSIFSTREQNRLADDYFMSSGGRICFFFEEDAFLPDGSLKQAKELSINKIGHALHDLDPVFDGFSRTVELRSLSVELGLVAPLLLQSMYIFKQPHIGGEVSCHQDSTFLYGEPDNVLGLWFALEDASLENGCLWAIPGGHRNGLKSRWVRGNEGMRFDVLDSGPHREEQLMPLEVCRGTLIVLHGLLPHKSLPNRSNRSRHAYTLHLMSAHNRYADDNWLQRPADFPFRGF